MSVQRDQYAVRTYRYLRLAMVVLIVLLLASVAYERLQTSPGCFQTSLSAYYFAPVQGVFVATLVALGTCMIVLKGAPGWEDVLLNVGGMLAVVVAFVPTTDVGTCATVLYPTRDVPAQVDNSIWALLVAGAVGLAVTVGVAVKQGDLSARSSRTTRANLAGIAMTGGLLVGGLGWFILGRDSFIRNAHDVAAVGLFVSIVGVVAKNAWDCRRAAAPARRYLAIVCVMVTVGAGLVVSQWFGFDHWALVAEAVVIGLFAVFWLLQTDELWNDGPRPMTLSPRRLDA